MLPYVTGVLSYTVGDASINRKISDYNHFALNAWALLQGPILKRKGISLMPNGLSVYELFANQDNAPQTNRLGSKYWEIAKL